MNSERGLMRRLRRGDTEALRELYECTLGSVYRFVYFRVGEDHEVTQDIVHDTFLRAVGALNGFSRRKGSVQAWLCGIARNCVLEHYRDVQRRDGAVQSLRHVQGQRSDPPELPQQDAVEDVKARVNLALAQMPELYSRALIMKYVHRKSMREIAQGFAKSEKAVESLLGRARDAFKRHFREDAFREGREAQ